MGHDFYTMIQRDYILPPNKADSRRNQIFADFCQIQVTFLGKIFRIPVLEEKVNS